MTDRSEARITSSTPLTDRRRGPRTGVLALLSVAALCVTAPHAAAQAEKSKAAGVSYAGSETCQPCHEDIAAGFAKSKHGVLDTSTRRGWAKQACESCHGSGVKHAESVDAKDIRQPAKLAPLAADSVCLSCHRNQQTEMGRIVNGHARSATPCTSCHTIHKTETRQAGAAVLSKAQRINQQCASCHQTTWAEFQKPHRHNLNEGAMSCVSCHNPHGTAAARAQRLTAQNEPGCFRCHADKRGPFVYEHAPMRLEGCSACHEPHGSANPRMLTRHQVGFQCLECHSNVVSPSAAGTLGGVGPAIHDLNNPRYKNCTVCHMKIHGSQVNRSFFR